MSGELESLLRREMADRADAAPPTVDDTGLADLAIAGAGRIRRRRNAAAASGTGLLVLAAAAFAWQPWTAPDPNEGTLAADTSTVEAQSELDMEFVVRGSDGAYSVLNSAGESVGIGDEEPTIGVYRLAGSYVSESDSVVAVTAFDGTAVGSFEKPSAETYTRVNTGGSEFAMISPNAEYTQEEYQLQDATLVGPADEEPATFTTAYDLSLMDWSASTVVFAADLRSTSGGGIGAYNFDTEYDWGLASVGAAGFESVAITDYEDPTYVCVADLEAGAGLARSGEQCGSLDSQDIQDELVATSSDEEAPELVREFVENNEAVSTYPMIEDFDLGEYETRYFESEMMWTDPLGRWQMTGSQRDDTWLLMDATTEEGTLSELTPPAGAVMPVLSYVLPGSPGR